MNMVSTTNTSKENRHFGFWGRLALSRKMLLAFGVLFVLALLIAVVTLAGSNRTQASYDNALVQGIEVRNVSDRLVISLLQARRAEKNFLLRWQTEGFDTAYANYVPTFSQEVSAARKDISQLAQFAEEAANISTGNMTHAQYSADITSLTLSLNTYVQSFNILVDAYRKRGFDENTGIQGEFQTIAQKIETKIFEKAGQEQLGITFLQIRQNEKNYLLLGDPKYIENIDKLIIQMKVEVAIAEHLNSDEKAELASQLDAYLSVFNSLAELDKNIEIYNNDLINAARAVEPLAANFEALGEQMAKDGVNEAKQNSTQTITVSFATVFIVLGTSILLSITLSRQITQPITQLTMTAQKIAEGNFDVQAEVTSADEVGTLAQSFNSMTSKLHQAFDDVRRRALAVQTSAEVSRRLSAATNSHQLAVEVVEQVQSAFNYYHAHIYLLDEETGDLVMAGGTGEAGATMLARGHKVSKGRGLVGRAADSNTSVLIPDVSQEAGWLPNELLPDTQSEAAIPISSGKLVLGVLDVQQNTVNGLTEEDVSLLQSLASQVFISLQNARSFEQAKQQAELESLVNAIGQKIQRTATVEDTLQTAIREIGLALGASRVSANIQSSREDVKASSN